MTIEITHPMYGHRLSDGKLVKAVGIAEWRVVLEGDIVQVKITQVYHSRTGKSEKDGKLIYNHIFCIRKVDVAKYPQKLAGDGKTVLRIIPLEDFYPKVFDKIQPQYYPPKNIEVAPENKPIVEQGRLI